MTSIIPILKRSLNTSPCMCKPTTRLCRTILRFLSATKSRNFAAALSIVGCIPRQSTHGRDSIQRSQFRLSKTCRMRGDNNRDRLATAATNGYGVAAAARSVSVALPTSDNSLLLEQFAAMAARIDAWETKTNPPVQPKKDSQDKYCYTHGLCAHSSKECRTPGPTHNVQATARNTMGGPAAKRRAKRN